MTKLKNRISYILILIAITVTAVALSRCDAIRELETGEREIPPRLKASLLVTVSPWHDIQQRNRGWIWGGEKSQVVGYTVTDEHQVIIGRTTAYDGDAYDFHPYRQRLFIIPPEMNPD